MAFPLVLGGCQSGSGGTAPTGSTSTQSTGTSTSSSAPTTSTADAGVPVAELFAAARKAAEAAESGRVTGTMVDDGEQVTIDLTGRVDGTNQRLKLTTADGTMTVNTVGGLYYLVADKEYWQKNAGDTAAEQLAGKWVLMSQEDAQSFGSFTLKSLLEDLFTDTEFVPLATSTARVPVTSVGGVAVRVLRDPSSDTGELVVAAEGAPLLVSAEVGGTAPEKLAFSQWDAVAEVKPPADKDVIKL